MDCNDSERFWKGPFNFSFPLQKSKKTWSVDVWWKSSEFNYSFVLSGQIFLFFFFFVGFPNRFFLWCSKEGQTLSLTKMSNTTHDRNLLQHLITPQRAPTELRPVRSRTQAQIQPVKVSTIVYDFFLLCCGSCISLTWLVVSSHHI